MRPRNDFAPGDIIGQKYQTWYDLVDTSRVSVEDLFRPQYWVNCLRLRSNDLIRCVANDGSYDFMLRVTSHKVTHNRNAITVSMWPKLTPDVVAAAEGTASAEMVPVVVAGKPVPRIEKLANGHWRLIGFDGMPVGDQHRSEDAADRAYDEYLEAHGIAYEIDRLPVDARTGDVVVPRPEPASPAKPPAVGDRPGQISYGKRKQIEKRQKMMNKRAEIDARNKARTAERLAAEAAAAGDAA